MNVVVKKISDSILFLASAQHVWKQLEHRFCQVDGTKVFQAQRDLYSISQGNMSILDYFTYIKKLWDDYNSLIIIPYCACGMECASYNAVNKLIQEQELMQFLVGLNKAYKVVQGNILMMRPLPDVDEAYNIFLQEEN